MSKVYFIRSHDAVGLIKIGYAMNPEFRLSQLQTGSAHRLSLMGHVTFDSEMQARDFEKRCHRTFWFCRKGGEWFSACEPLRMFIASCCSGNDPYIALFDAHRSSKKKATKAQVTAKCLVPTKGKL